jgi:large subunit ribosomal protein L35
VSVRQTAPHRGDHRSGLDEVWSGADDVEDSHRGVTLVGRSLLLQCRTRMPKMKTHSGAKKRFKKSATGKIRGRHAFSSHILEKKSPKKKRNLARPAQIAKVDVPNVRKLLGGGK